MTQRCGNKELWYPVPSDLVQECHIDKAKYAKYDIYIFQKPSIEGKEMPKRYYKLLKIIESIKNTDINLAFVKEIFKDENGNWVNFNEKYDRTKFSLTKSDCSFLELNYEDGIEPIPIEIFRQFKKYDEIQLNNQDDLSYCTETNENGLVTNISFVIKDFYVENGYIVNNTLNIIENSSSIYNIFKVYQNGLCCKFNFSFQEEYNGSLKFNVSLRKPLHKEELRNKKITDILDILYFNKNEMMLKKYLDYNIRMSRKLSDYAKHELYYRETFWIDYDDRFL